MSTLRRLLAISIAVLIFNSIRYFQLKPAATVRLNLNLEESQVALCYIGVISTLRNPALQANALNYVVKPLGATVFMHLGLRADDGGLHKEIFQPAELNPSELSALHQRLQTSAFKYQEEAVPPASSFKCDPTSSSSADGWFVEVARLLSPSFEHAKGCLSLISEHEQHKRRSPFRWVIFSRTDVMFLPSPHTRELVENYENMSVAFVDVTNTSETFKIGGRVQMMRREDANKYVGFVDRLKQQGCTDLATARCSKWCGECAVTSFWLQNKHLELRSLGDFIPYAAVRSCGTQADCTDIANHILEEYCARDEERMETHFECQKMKKYYSGKKRPTIYGTA